MVAKGFRGRFVLPETLVSGIVVMVDPFSLPVAVALDAKMVVVLPCQLAVSGCRFQNTMGQGNGGGYAGLFHTSYGPVLMSIDVLLAGDALGDRKSVV